MKKILFTLLLSAVAGACIQPPTPPKAPALDIEIAVASTQPATWKAADYQGKPVLIAFMGTWCPWCKKALPDMDAVTKEYKDQVEVVIAFADEDLKTVQATAKEHKINGKVLYNAGQAATAMNVQGFPHIMLFDANHRIAQVWSGYSPTLEQDFKKELSKILK